MYFKDDVNFNYNFNEKEIFVIDQIHNEKWMVFHDEYDEEFDEDLINEIKKYDCIKFGYNFNKSIDNLPDNIKKIVFGRFFDKKIDNLPNSVKYIQFGVNESEFNQEVNYLPESLKVLNLENCYSFNKDLSNLPKSLKVLKLHNYVQDIPDSVEYLKFYFHYGEEIDIPDNIKYLTLSPFEEVHNKKINFSENLEYVHFNFQVQLTKTELNKMKNIEHIISVFNKYAYQYSSDIKLNTNILLLSDESYDLMNGRNFDVYFEEIVDDFEFDTINSYMNE